MISYDFLHHFFILICDDIYANFRWLTLEVNRWRYLY